MSTKIYNGLIAVDKNPFTVQRRVRDVIEPMFYSKFRGAMELARSRAGMNWLDAFGPLPDRFRSGHYAKWDCELLDDSHMTGKLYGLIEALKTDTYHTFSDLDFGYEVLLLPNGREADDRPLVLLFSERAGDEYRKALIDAGVVSEYAYFDNTDKPDEISGFEWGQRKRAWSKLDVPASDSLGIQMPGRMSTRMAMWKGSDEDDEG